MNIKKIDHIGIAVNDCQKAANFFTSTLGLIAEGIETLEDMKLKIAKVSSSEVCIELLEPLKGETIISKFLKKRGEGIHHICFEVADINTSMSTLLSKGFKTVYETPQKGVNGKLVNFLKPHNTFGMLIELSQRLKP